MFLPEFSESKASSKVPSCTKFVVDEDITEAHYHQNVRLVMADSDLCL